MPSATPAPAQSPGTLPPPARRNRPVLLVIAIALGALVLVGGAVGIFVYDKATEIDRSTPTVATREFLQAGLVERDVNRLSLFVCKRWPALDAMNTLGPGADSSVRMNWGVTSVQENGDQADVIVRVTSTIDGHSDIETWRLTVVREDGWRVCSMERGLSLNP